jgi:hypothetical protein
VEDAPRRGERLQKGSDRQMGHSSTSAHVSRAADMRQAAGSALCVGRRTDESDQTGCDACQNCDGPRYDSSSQEEAGQTGTDDEGPPDSRPIGRGRLGLDLASARSVVICGSMRGQSFYLAAGESG